MVPGLIRNIAAHLFPGYFALVMATGIVSIACALRGFTFLAWVLLVVNVAAYAVLCILVAARMIYFFPNLLEDLKDHARGPGFFSLVAGTCVLGSQVLILCSSYSVAIGLWVLGLFLWVLVMYSFFTAVVIRKDKPSLEAGINGAWLIAIVATQSVSILGTLISPAFSEALQPLLYFTLCMFLLGCMLYIAIITLIFYRFTFLNLTSAALTPPYWINMGAVAITTLAGATLMLHAHQWEFLVELLPFVRGFTIFFWITGTWWIPLLFILGFWRHVYKRHPFTYDPQYWGMVFPLGMYTACTHQLAKGLDLHFLYIIPEYFIFIALAAWAVVFVGLLRMLWKALRGSGCCGGAAADPRGGSDGAEPDRIDGARTAG